MRPQKVKIFVLIILMSVAINIDLSASQAQLSCQTVDEQAEAYTKKMESGPSPNELEEYLEFMISNKECQTEQYAKRLAKVFTDYYLRMPFKYIFLFDTTGNRFSKFLEELNNSDEKEVLYHFLQTFTQAGDKHFPNRCNANERSDISTYILSLFFDMIHGNLDKFKGIEILLINLLTEKCYDDLLIEMLVQIYDSDEVRGKRIERLLVDIYNSDKNTVSMSKYAVEALTQLGLNEDGRYKLSPIFKDAMTFATNVFYGTNQPYSYTDILGWALKPNICLINKTGKYLDGFMGTSTDKVSVDYDCTTYKGSSTSNAELLAGTFIHVMSRGMTGSPNNHTTCGYVYCSGKIDYKIKYRDLANGETNQLKFQGNIRERCSKKEDCKEHIGESFLQEYQVNVEILNNIPRCE